MHNLSIDIETYSSADLAKVGVYKYSEADDFEILLFGYSIDHGPVSCVDLAAGEELPQEILKALTDPYVLSDEADRCGRRLQELQEELVRRVTTGESYDDLSDEIRELKEQRDKAQERQAAQNNYLKHKQEVQEFLEQRKTGGPIYRDSLVRKMIARIEVYRNRLIFTFKTGNEVEISI